MPTNKPVPDLTDERTTMSSALRYVSTKIIERLLSMHGVTVDHCCSCHADDDYGLYELPEICLTRNRFTLGCCGMREAVEKHVPHLLQ